MFSDVIDALKVPFLKRMCGESTCELASLHLSRYLALCQRERNFSFMNTARERDKQKNRDLDEHSWSDNGPRAKSLTFNNFLPS